MYVSNQTRLRRYRKQRRIEEANSDEIQMKLYEQIANETEDQSQASMLAKMANRVGANLNDEEVEAEKDYTGDLSKLGKKEKKVSGLALLMKAISAGKMNEFVKAMAQVPDAVLDTNSKITKKVISDEGFKKAMNQNLEKMVSQGETAPKKIVSALVMEIKANPLFNKMRQRLDSSMTGTSDPASGSVDPIAAALGEISDQINPDLLNESSFVDEEPDDASTITLTNAELLKDKTFTPDEFKRLNKTSLQTILTPIPTIVDAFVPVGGNAFSLTYSQLAKIAREYLVIQRRYDSSRAYSFSKDRLNIWKSNMSAKQQKKWDEGGVVFDV